MKTKTVSADKPAILTSIKLQHMINIKDLDSDLWCPVLRFGRTKKGEFKFPLVFKDFNKAEKLYDELIGFKGQSIEAVRAKADKLYTKYKKYDYRSKLSNKK